MSQCCGRRHTHTWSWTRKPCPGRPKKQSTSSFARPNPGTRGRVTARRSRTGALGIGCALAARSCFPCHWPWCSSSSLITYNGRPDGTLTHLLPHEIDEWMVTNGFKGKPGPLALNTVQHRLAVLSKAHQVRDDIAPEQNPCRHIAVRDLLATTRKAYAKRGAVPRKLDALTRDRLQAILATCGDDIRGIRDRALLLFAWSSGGRRRSEVAAADLQFLTRRGSGFTYRLAHSKTNQSGSDHPENYKPIQGEAADALRAWLLESGVRTGPLFRRILKGDRVGGALSSEGVAKIVKARCQAAALGGRFSAHSLRSGFLTEAGAQEIPLKTAMAMSGHKSVSVAMGYMHVGALDQSPAATLLDNVRSIRSKGVRRG